MRNAFFLLFASIAALLVEGPVRASVTYEYVTDQSSYTASAGSVTVNVYLQETLTAGSTSLINPPPATNEGMFSTAFAVNVVSGPGTITNITFNQNAIASNGFGPNSAGAYLSGTTDQNYINGSGSTGGLFEQVTGGSLNGPMTSDINGINGIFLGTVTISGVTSETDLNLTSLKNAPVDNAMAQGIGEGDTVTLGSNGYNLDSTNNAFAGGGATYTGADDNTFTFSVAAVPEPSSMILSGLAAIGFGIWRRQRHQNL